MIGVLSPRGPFLGRSPRPVAARVRSASIAAGKTDEFSGTLSLGVVRLRTIDRVFSVVSGCDLPGRIAPAVPAWAILVA